MAWSSCSKPPVSIAQWMPHSLGAFTSHHQRPARVCSPGAQPPDELEGLRRQAASVDAEDADLRVDRVGHVEQRDAVDLERGRERDPRREALEGPLEHDLRLLALELDRELAGLELVGQLDAHAATSSRSRCRAGSMPASSPSSSSERRRQKSVKGSPSKRSSSQPWTRPSTASSSSSERTRRNSGRPIAAPGPSPPRTKMS